MNWDFWSHLLDSSGFMPRRFCGGAWTPGLIRMHQLSDFLIWLAYVAIPVVLVTFAWKRRNELPFRSIFLLFGLFILACGTTHLLDMLMFDYPLYRLSGLVKLITAAASWGTVLALVRLVPLALEMKSPDALEHEVNERRAAEEKFRSLNADLEARVLERTSELQASSNRFAAIVSSSAHIIWTRDVTGKFSSPQPSWSDFTGQSFEALQNEKWLSAIHPDDRERVAQGWRKSVKSDDGYSIDYRLRRADGEYRFMEVRGVPVRDEAGNIREWVGTSLDVTERKRDEDELATRARMAALSAEVALTLTRADSIQDTLQNCADALVKHLDVAFARIWTVSQDGEVLELQASAGQYTHLNGPHGRVPVGQFKIGLIAQERKPHLTNQVVGDARVGDQEWAKREGMVAFAGYPLIVENDLMGVIAAFARQPLTDDALQAMTTIADAVAIGIQRKRAVAELRESQEQFQTMADSIPQLAWMAEAEGDIFWYNRRWYEYTGTDFESMQGWGWEKVNHPDHVAHIVESWKESLQNGIPWEREFPLRAANGEYNWFLTQARPVRDDDGAIVRWFGTNTDITQARQVQADLRQSESRFRRMVESNLAGVITFDLNGKILDCNDAFLETIRYTRADLNAGKIDWLSMTPAEYSDLDARAVEELVSAGRHAAVEKQYIRKDGTRADILVASALFDESSTQGIGVVVDISSRKRAEADLSQSEARKTAILQSALDCIIGIDENSHIIEWNPAAEKTFGYSRQEAMGKILPELIIPETLRAAHFEGMKKYLATGEGAVLNNRIEVPALRRDGTEFPVELAVTRIAIEGEPLFTAYLRDITVRKQTEIDLQRARENAETANRTKSLFLANMSHELRTPLNAILGYSEMLHEDMQGEQPEVAADLQKINTAGKHLLALISDILDLSKIEAGKMETFIEEFPVDPIVQELVLTVAPLAQKNRNTLRVECAPDLGTLQTDLTKFRQSVLNLLSNAAKFTHDGEIVVEAAREKMDNRDWIVLKVCDTGIGMSADEVVKLFRPFTQADASTTRKFGGTGLGLALTRRFCQMLGGDVSVASTPGEGSTFTIKLPVSLDEISITPSLVVVEPSTPINGDERVHDGEPVEPMPAPGTCVLVIDDDASQREVLKRFLKREGFISQTASGGQDGLDLARRLQPIAIVLDVMMPDMDGWSVLANLKADAKLRDIPVIMLTMVDDRKRGFAIGASDYLTKPVNRAELGRVLSKYSCPEPPCPVLVIEDEPEIRSLMRVLLEAEGWHVAEAGNGREALRQVEENRPALILLDLMMPDMDGFEFAATLRHHDQWKTIPVVVLTAMELTAEDRLRLNGYVEKVIAKAGLSRDDLLQQVRELVASSLDENRNALSGSN